jgi:serine protease Do
MAANEQGKTGATYAKSLSTAFHDAASKVLPSVVMITNTPAIAQSEERKPAPDGNSEEMPFGFKGTPFGDLLKNPEFRHFFKEFPSLPKHGMPGHEMAGAGSGVIVDPSGVVLTNNHVVAGGGKIMVRLQDGREFPAVDIKTDPKSDLAVLRLKGTGPFPAAQLGDSSKVDVGEWVLALGQPFGLQGTVTAGIISAKGRGIGITDQEDFLQTDAAINPGNSGGPLINLDGQVIGINTAISSSNGGYQGVGFSIPVDLAKWVGGQLVTDGKVNRAYLGVIIQQVTQPLAEQFKVKVHEGVLVTEVQPRTPAAKAGLKAGDIIVDFAGKAVSDPRELQGAVEMAKAGSTRPLTILRDGKRLTLQVTCGEMPANAGMARAGSPGQSNAETSHFEKLGIQVENLTPQVAEQLGIKAEHGVVITDVRSGSPAELAGLTNGMVITEAERQPVKTVDDFRKALGNKPLEKGVLLLIRTAEGTRFVVLRVGSE